MAKAKKFETVFLVSGEETGFFYSQRRKRGAKKKLSLRKYDPIARKHVVFQEKKLSRLKKKYKGTPSEAPENSASEE